ncbi:MAG TPA: 2'-5' RNA ligase family protein [Aliidongia sp.]|nr:2'-5' RNA ligase family protein [Aliidongia sp.]
MSGWGTGGDQMSSRRRMVDPNQLQFDFWNMRPKREPPPSRTPPHDDSVFFAVQPDLAAASRFVRFAEAQKSGHGLSGPLRPAGVLHVSLVPLGPYHSLPDEIIELAKHAASTVRFPEFTVAFNHTLGFQGNENGYPFVLGGDDGVVGLLALHEALGAALGQVGLEIGRHRITPHMTLLYDRRSIGMTMLDEPLTWTAREFVLVRSWHGQGRYERLGAWPLSRLRHDA